MLFWAPILALASINSSSSRDLGASLPRLACTPTTGTPRCKTVQYSRTPPCWTYGPTAGTRINPYVTVLPLASTIWDEEHVASSLVGAGPPGQDTDRGNLHLSMYISMTARNGSMPCFYNIFDAHVFMFLCSCPYISMLEQILCPHPYVYVLLSIWAN